MSQKQNEQKNSIHYMRIGYFSGSISVPIVSHSRTDGPEVVLSRTKLTRTKIRRPTLHRCKRPTAKIMLAQSTELISPQTHLSSTSNFDHILTSQSALHRFPSSYLPLSAPHFCVQSEDRNEQLALEECTSLRGRRGEGRGHLLISGDVIYSFITGCSSC